jgi:hypothetical protein
LLGDSQTNFKDYPRLKLRILPASRLQPHNAIFKMTSEGARRLSIKSHQRTSSKSSSTATSVHAPLAGGVSNSPATIMPATVDVLRDELEHAQFNGSIKASKRSSRAHLDRKASTPMMPAFMVSAPGKVIVFGEHAVVHGKVRIEDYLDCLSPPIDIHRPPLLPPSLFDPTSSSPHSPSRSAQSHCDSPTYHCRIHGI